MNDDDDFKGLAKNAQVIDVEPSNLIEYKHAKRFVFSGPVPYTDYAEDSADVSILEAMWPGCTEPTNVYPPHHYYIKRLDDNTFLIEWSNDDEERLIGPKFCYDGSDEKIPYVIWQMYNVDDIARFEAGAPGYGHITFKVTRKDDEGLFGICIEDTTWVPDYPEM